MNLETVKKEFTLDLEKVTDLNSLNEIRINYLGKKSILTELSKNLANISLEEKKEQGAIINELRNFIMEQIDALKEKLETEKINQTLKSSKIDVSLPAYKFKQGSAHPVEKITEQIEDFFIAMGYDVVEGPELERDLYNFEMLNLPKGHPARDAQDTFYIKGDEYLLRSQTSPVQVRTMIANKEKTAIRILCPGKTYRRDNDDASHSHNFTQIEGLLVDKNISLADLKGTFDALMKKLFGENRLTRFRPSYYPFTEPSVEMDVSCFNCGQKGCNICKNTGWITIGGAGMIHPNVLNMSGYDSEKYTGFAFGFGAERIAMLKYGITDIRTFYNNDLRFNRQFDKRVGENNEN